jgi:hypothetical protein
LVCYIKGLPLFLHTDIYQKKMPRQIIEEDTTESEGETIGTEDSPRSTDESWYSADGDILSDTEDFPQWIQPDSEWTPED